MNNDTSDLTNEQLEPLLHEAINRFAASAIDVSKFSHMTVQIKDLPGTTLGMAAGNTIFLDSNAAGRALGRHGVHHARHQGEMNRMDLLTVLTHELGHILGYEHKEDGVMQETLVAGERHLPGFDSSGEWEEALFALAVEQNGGT